MATDRPDTALWLLLGVALVGTLFTHVRYLPQYGLEVSLDGLPIVGTGWLSFALVFYALGRVLSDPPDLPSMRGADIGIGLVVVALLLAGGLSNYGFSPRAIPGVYVSLVVVFYGGLALVGWSLGQRTRAVNRIVANQ